MTSIIGDGGTGHKSAFCLQEEKSFKTLGTGTNTDVWLRRRRHNFGSVPAYLPSNSVGTSDLPAYALSVESYMGMCDAELEPLKFPWLLKWFMGSYSKSNVGRVYTHVFKFGDNEKSCQVLENKGGLSSAYIRNYLAYFPNRISFNTGMNDSAWVSIGFIGVDDINGAALASRLTTPAPAGSEYRIGFRNEKYYVGTAGATTIAAMTQWKLPYDLRLDMSRPDATADDFRADGTGKSNSLFTGTPSVSLTLMAQFDMAHKLADFDGRTETSFGIRLDTGKIISGSDTYRIDIIFPRVVIPAYPVDIQGEGSVKSIVNINPMVDPTAVYGMMINVINDVTDYPDAVDI